MADEESSYAQRSNRRSRDPAPPSRAKKDVKVTAIASSLATMVFPLGYRKTKS